MQFRIPLSNNHSVTLERDTIGNIIVAVYNDHAGEPIANGVERGKDFKTMAEILGD